MWDLTRCHDFDTRVLADTCGEPGRPEVARIQAHLDPQCLALLAAHLPQTSLWFGQISVSSGLGSRPTN